MTVIPFEPPHDWRDEALCREVDLELFFPEKGNDHRPAVRVCSMCPVREACLADVLRLPSFHDEFGIRGGLSPNERAKLRRKAS
jgi:hypothetical protein